jgi:3',5'-cyclic AMP phosphodiesterase CpdA
MAGTAALLSGRSALAAGTAPTTAPASQRRRSLRFAHLTDVHVEPERAADHGMAACLDHVQSQSDKPEMILFGGDCVFDTAGHDQTRSLYLWDLWKKVLKDHCSLPWKAGIGNHDVFGMDKAKSKTNGSEPLYGKKMAMNQLGIANTYYSFDLAGWHFIVLDSIHVKEGGYKGELDQEQFEWLQDDLKKTDPKTPVVVQTHLPIVSVTSMVTPRPEVDGDVYRIRDVIVHADYDRLRKLFRAHRNVKLALSGHTHFLDRVDSDGVTYICDGAVSGDWWRGNHLDECDCGYGILDLYDDGTFDHQYVTYGWKPVPGQEPA